MILVGIENCSSCRIAKLFLPDLQYIELTKKSSGDKIYLELKRLLLKLNPTKQFPVIVDDRLTKLINTDFVMHNLNMDRLRNELENI